MRKTKIMYCDPKQKPMAIEVIGSNVNTTVNALLDGCDTCLHDCLLQIFFFAYL